MAVDPDYDLVIETYTAICPRYEELGFDGLTKPERVIFCAWQFVSEVNNGGVYQFFFNPSGEFAEQTVFALKEVHMPFAASILSRAIAAFPSPAKDQQIRTAQLLALPMTVQDLFTELTRAFFDSPEDAYRLQAEYVRQHQ